MNIHGRHDAVLAGFILCSLLLHFLLLHFLPARRLLTDLGKKEPVVVEVRPPQARERELDLPPQPDQPEPRKKLAKRLGPSDRTVPKEIAPKGEAPEDRLPVPQLPAIPPPPATTATAAPGARPLPDPSAIDLNLAQSTRGRYQQEWRRKYRKEVEEGDAVWLDTEKDILLSFFDRFRRNIYNVWNYPPQSVRSREQGICLLEIIINRDGSVDSVALKEPSGYPTLDREAVAAVYRGASYGQLPTAYAEDKLKIMAFFQYRLTLSGQRGGDIFGAR